MDEKAGKTPGEIKFRLDNKYLKEEETTYKSELLIDKAKKLLEEGNVNEAILCLEAEVQGRKYGTVGWRMLGGLYRENYQNNYAYIALNSAHTSDPYDLKTLMLLGILCVSEQAESEALLYFTDWLKYNKKY